jgi:signal transduction histidine kinase
VRPAAQRPLLAGTTYAGDIALAVVFTIAALWAAIRGYLQVSHDHLLAHPGATYALGPAGPHSPPVPVWVLVGVVATTAPLAFRRTYPTSAFCMILAAFIATEVYSTAITAGAAIFAGYGAVVYSKHRRIALLGLLTAAVIVTVVYPESAALVPQRYIALLVLLPTVAAGYMMRTWRAQAGDSAERLRLAQAGHETEKLRAVELERARIASELHDVVTHNVSIMVVQAGAARRVLDQSPGDAREALLAIEASGRTAMTELRHLLGLLVPAGEEAAGEEAVGGAARRDEALSPQPGVAGMGALIAGVSAAGLPVELSVASVAQPPPVLPPGIDLAAYRLVQEALTNVLKHAGAAHTTVQLEYRPDELRITICDDGQAAPATAPAPDPVRGLPPGRSGRGLIGLRERIAIYGGELDAGPRPGGGWRVGARIPLEPTAGPAAGAKREGEGVGLGLPVRAGYQAAPS